MIAHQANMRAAAVQLLEDFRTDTSRTLQIYRARPATIKPPTAFVDRLFDTLTDFLAPDVFQHAPRVQIVVLHGLFDHGDTVDQRDDFIDGFVEWCRTRFHAAGANSLLAVSTVEDDPTYVPEWLPEDRRLTYYGTVITLEGLSTD